MDHDYVTSIVAAQGGYGKGVRPNPFAQQQAEWVRRRDVRGLRQMISDKIDSLFEPRFITPPETSELIESIVTATDSRRVLEVGMCTGFTSLHILRAIAGKAGAKLFSIDARPAHDRDFFTSQFIKPWFEFVEGWTPDIISTLAGEMFDLVFVDSDHSVEHTQKELGALWPITKKGTIFLFHDVPEWQAPNNRQPVPIRNYLFSKVTDGTFQGSILPTCEQLDCVDAWGVGYPKQCNPGLGIFTRL
jgi:predicted O-methyltransferase YrrM